MTPFKENITEFTAYLISKRAIELEKRKITSGFSLEAAKTVVKDGKAKFEAASRK